MRPADADRVLFEIGERLADELQNTIPGWVEQSVERIYSAWHGSTPEAIVEASRAAGRTAAEDLMPGLRALLSAEVDEQWTNPMRLIRAVVVHPNSVLVESGVPEIVRDDFDQRTAPDDIYGIAPVTFSDIDPELHDIGLAWGAAKAGAHLARRRE